MTKSVPTHRKSTDKEANAMASNDVEVLDPAASVEKSKEIASERVLNRRHFIAALGVAGAAAGTGLVSTPSAVAQQPLQPGGYSQVDVMNFVLNLKYLKATLYAFLTTGKDIAPQTGVTTGSGVLYNAPTQITFSTQQITDLFNEMYYDELNQLIALRSLQGVAAANRGTMNLLGTGTITPPTTTITQSQAIGLARLLEDLSAQAFATASIYLTGSNLAFVNQVLAVDGFHAGAVRLLAIQTGAQYQSTQFAGSSSSTAVTPVAFTGSTTSGSNLISAYLGALTLPTPAVGNILTGIGVPPGAVVTAIVGATQFTGTAAVGSSTVTSVSSIAGLAVGQVIVGPGIPGATTITAIGVTAPFNLSLSAPATASNSGAIFSVLINSTPIGVITSGSKTLTGVSNTTGLGAGQVVTGTNIPTNTIITGVTSNTISLSAAPTATPAAISPTGVVTLGSNVITLVSSITGLFVGQQISGTGIPAGSTITAINSVNGAAPFSITISSNVTATSTVAPTGSVTKGSTLVNFVSALTSVNVGAGITGTGIPAGTTVTATSTGPNTITLSNPATISSVISLNGIVTTGSAVITAVSSITGVTVGQSITGAGIPANTTVSSIGTTTITMSAPATASSGTAVPIAVGVLENLTVVAPETLTITGSVLTIGSTTITISGNSTLTGVNTINVIVQDSQDVVPADIGAGAANGPTAIAGSTPPLYQGFFDTAGAATASANNPSGFLFARSFQQILAVLYDYNPTTSQDTSQNFSGGFFPITPVTGAINSAI
jgi:Ferritin-like domain